MKTTSNGKKVKYFDLKLIGIIFGFLLILTIPTVFSSQKYESLLTLIPLSILIYLPFKLCIWLGDKVYFFFAKRPQIGKSIKGLSESLNQSAEKSFEKISQKVDQKIDGCLLPILIIILSIVIVFLIIKGFKLLWNFA